MAITGPQLVSASALPVEMLVIRAGADAYLLVNKAHQGAGFPRRELEVFTLAEVIAAASGPYFFNVNPLPLQLLTDSFAKISAVATSGSTLHLYYNTTTVAGGQETIFRQNVDAATRQAQGAKETLPFDGIDPFILDGRTGGDPNRLYLVYVDSAGQLLLRTSLDLGATWGSTVTIEGDPPAVRIAEATLLDPLGDKVQIQVLMQRD